MILCLGISEIVAISTAKYVFEVACWRHEAVAK